MPEEIGRTTAVKYIALPGGARVPVPVITKIIFIDASDRYWETQYTIDNSETSARQIHVDLVRPSVGGGDPISVERIDVWPVDDTTDRGQETQVTIDNITGADSVPPHFSTHLKTHVVRYYQNPAAPNNDAPWIDVEVIDELSLQDASDRFQETILSLDWKDEQADLNDPDITGTGTIDPPFRLDPFQNIIDFNGTVIENTGAEPFRVANGGNVALEFFGGNGFFSYAVPSGVQFWGKVLLDGSIDMLHGADVNTTGTVSWTGDLTVFHPTQQPTASVTGQVITISAPDQDGSTKTAVLDISGLIYTGVAPGSMHNVVLTPEEPILFPLVIDPGIPQVYRIGFRIIVGP